ncbi:hypothetical protein J1N35_038113 [Gossypium stocksii]|uniref:Uncharacterized protein n=1 Tax=Gossypium stocksii TaxID=47602 RepID=A0A9D3ZMB9_9ROSI|nr:hypothetical protein J1N35_038113 [Gossypium stocksii]
MEALKRAHELYANLDKDKRKLLKHNRRLQEHLTFTQKDIEKLHEEITSE